MAQKKVEYKDYADYLKSDKWKQVKKDYAENESIEECVCCSLSFKNNGITPHYHHFRYPKDWNGDSWENLIIVCKKCHTWLHGEFEHSSEDITLRSYMSMVLLQRAFYDAEEAYKLKKDIDALHHVLAPIFHKDHIKFTFETCPRGINDDISDDLAFFRLTVNKDIFKGSDRCIAELSSGFASSLKRAILIIEGDYHG